MRGTARGGWAGWYRGAAAYGGSARRPLCGRYHVLVDALCLCPALCCGRPPQAVVVRRSPYKRSAPGAERSSRRWRLERNARWAVGRLKPPDCPLCANSGSGGTSPLPGALAPAVVPPHGFIPQRGKKTQGTCPLRGAHSGALAFFYSLRCPCSARRGTPPRRRGTHANGGGVGGCPLLVLRHPALYAARFCRFFGALPPCRRFWRATAGFFSCFAAPVAGAFSFVSSCRFAALRDDGARPLPRGKAARQRPRAAATNRLPTRFASRLPIVTRSSSPRRAAVPAGLDKRVIMIVRRRDASRLPLSAECRGTSGSLFFARSSRKKCLH